VDEYTLRRLYREQEMVKTCQYEGVEWTSELEEERRICQVLFPGVATVIRAKGIG